MFDFSPEKMPPEEPTMVGMGIPKKPDQTMVDLEQTKEVSAFLEPLLNESEGVWIPLMAAAEDHDEWNDLSEEIVTAGGPVLTGAQLRSAMKGSEVMKKASALFQRQEKNGEDEEPGMSAAA